MNYLYLAIIILLASLYLYERLFGGESRKEKRLKKDIEKSKKEIKKSNKELDKLKIERLKINEEIDKALDGLSVAKSMRTSSRRAKR